MSERQITHGPYGHTLNAAQVFSPDGQWVVYDTRNDDAHISRTGKIERVNLQTGKIEVLYTTKEQTLFGPGVGAVAYHPIDDKVIFIHGQENSNESNPYGFTRRFGAIVNVKTPGTFVHAEGRVLNSPLIEGTLRGGTHAHTWSNDGEYISFTYNDQIMERLEKETKGKVKDLRTIGMMITDRPTSIDQNNQEEFAGTCFAFVTATVVDDPQPGTDAINRAFDECWIGKNGYERKDGQVQRRAIAFQGNVMNTNGEMLTEVFVADVPDEIQSDAHHPIQGTLWTRPNVPTGLVQRRITFTASMKYPGIQGPRCRLRTSAAGDVIYFHMKDDAGNAQIFRVATMGGSPEQITYFEKAIEAQYNVSPDGRALSCISDGRIWVVDLKNKTEKAITDKNTMTIVGGALWSPDGKQLVYNRFVGSGETRFLQIFNLAVTN